MLDVKSGTVSEKADLSKALIQARMLLTVPAVWWSVSGDGKGFAVTSVKPGADTVTIVPIAGGSPSASYELSASYVIPLYFWFPGTSRWLRIEQTRINPLATWNTGGSTQSAVLPIEKAYPLGLVSTNSLLFMNELSNGSAGQKDVQIEELQLQPLRVSRKWNLRLPFRASVQMEELSPSGSRILWKLLDPDSMRTGWMDKWMWSLFRFHKSWRSSLWISRTDGSAFKRLGALPPSEAFGKTFQWSPDERKISTSINGRIYIIPVPGPN
jgi:hypothetical protein